MKHIIKIEIDGPKQMKAFLKKRAEDIRSDLASDFDMKEVSVKAKYKSENGAGKHCDWCGEVIGSKDFKTFVSTKDPKEEIFFHLFCYNEMKNKGIIG